MNEMCEQMEMVEPYNKLDVVTVRLVKEPSIVSETPITSSKDASALVERLISEFDREVFCILNIASDGKPIGLNIASIGTLNAALVSPREVFKSSVLSNAAAFIAFHCHPSGNPKPSREDAYTTQKLRDAGDLLDIKMLDHIVVGCGSGKTFSFKGSNLLDGKDVGKAYDNYRQSMDWER